MTRRRFLPECLILDRRRCLDAGMAPPVAVPDLPPGEYPTDGSPLSPFSLILGDDGSPVLPAPDPLPPLPPPPPSWLVDFLDWAPTAFNGAFGTALPPLSPLLPLANPTNYAH